MLLEMMKTWGPREQLLADIPHWFNDGSLLSSSFLEMNDKYFALKGQILKEGKGLIDRYYVGGLGCVSVSVPSRLTPHDWEIWRPVS